MHRIYFLAASFLIFGCNSYEKEKKAALLVAREIHADKCEIVFKEYADTDNRNRKNIVLTFRNFKDTLEDPKEKITSIAALLYLKQFEKSTYKEYDDIKIILEDNPVKFEKTYSLQDMNDVEPLFGVIQKFIDATNENNFKQVKQTVDESSIPDSTLVGTAKFISEIDSIYGKVNHTTYMGFHFDNLKETNEPVLVSWVQTNHSNTTTDFKFIISQSSKKIIYVGVNQTD